MFHLDTSDVEKRLREKYIHTYIQKKFIERYSREIESDAIVFKHNN